MEMTRIIKFPETLQLTDSLPVTAAVGQSDSGLLIALGFAVISLILAIHCRRQRQAQHRQFTNNQTALTELLASIDLIESRTQHFDQSIEKLSRQIDQIKLAQNSKAGMRQAQHLIQEGASTEQLIEMCGLSRGEAELFQRLHA